MYGKRRRGNDAGETDAGETTQGRLTLGTMTLLGSGDALIKPTQGK